MYIKIARRNINSLRHADHTILMGESKEELKRLLMRVKKDSEKAGLELNIQKTKIMASSSLTSCQIKENKWKQWQIFLDSEITVDSDCSHKIQRCLLPGRKVMTNLDNMLRSWDITLRTKVHIVKARDFPVVMYRCESWTVKKAEHWRTYDFKLWCWRRLLKIPWTARRSNWSIIKEIYPEYSLEGLMLKIQYFGHLMWRTNSLEKTQHSER